MLSRQSRCLQSIDKETGLCHASMFYICLVSTADICPASAGDVYPGSTDIVPVATGDLYPVLTEGFCPCSAEDASSIQRAMTCPLSTIGVVKVSLTRRGRKGSKSVENHRINPIALRSLWIRSCGPKQQTSDLRVPGRRSWVRLLRTYLVSRAGVISHDLSLKYAWRSLIW